MYNKLFDLNGDGQMDASERALEYMTFRAVTGLDEQETVEQDEENCDG